MRFLMLYSGEQILSFKSCLVVYAGDSLMLCIKFSLTNVGLNVLEKKQTKKQTNKDTCLSFILKNIYYS